MITNVHTFSQKTQEFILRLFVEPFGFGSPRKGSYRSYSQSYTCARCGTYTRLHQ